jgi:hypothetical protein
MPSDQQLAAETPPLPREAALATHAPWRRPDKQRRSSHWLPSHWRRRAQNAVSSARMTLNPTARATARRNVVDRFDRFLNGLEHARRQPNRRELFWLRDALTSLDEADYPAGEDAMDKAERALSIPEHAANDPSTNADMTLQELRVQLDQILRAGP